MRDEVRAPGVREDAGGCEPGEPRDRFGVRRGGDVGRRRRLREHDCGRSTSTLGSLEPLAPLPSPRKANAQRTRRAPLIRARRRIVPRERPRGGVRDGERHAVLRNLGTCSSSLGRPGRTIAPSPPTSPSTCCRPPPICSRCGAARSSREITDRHFTGPAAGHVARAWPRFRAAKAPPAPSKDDGDASTVPLAPAVAAARG